MTSSSSTAAGTKNKGGRPVKQATAISWRVPNELLAKIDLAAKALGKDRTMMLEHIAEHYFRRESRARAGERD